MDTCGEEKAIPGGADLPENDTASGASHFYVGRCKPVGRAGCPVTEGGVRTEAEEVHRDQLEKGLECQDRGLHLSLRVMGSHERSLSRGVTCLRQAGWQGAVALHTRAHTCLVLCLSLPHSSSFQDWVLEVLMNSLLMPLSGESTSGGRAGRGLVLRRPRCCCDAISSCSGSVPGRSSSNLFRVALPSRSFRSHTVLPPELTSIHSSGRDWNPVFLELAAICLSLRAVSVGASASLSLLGVGSFCLCPARAVCLSVSPGPPSHRVGLRTPPVSLSLPRPSPPWTFSVTRSSFLPRSCLNLSSCLLSP